MTRRRANHSIIPHPIGPTIKNNPKKTKKKGPFSLFFNATTTTTQKKEKGNDGPSIGSSFVRPSSFPFFSFFLEIFFFFFCPGGASIFFFLLFGCRIFSNSPHFFRSGCSERGESENKKKRKKMTKKGEKSKKKERRFPPIFFFFFLCVRFLLSSRFLPFSRFPKKKFFLFLFFFCLTNSTPFFSRIEFGNFLFFFVNQKGERGTKEKDLPSFT